MIPLLYCDLFPSCRIISREFIFVQIFRLNFTKSAFSLTIKTPPDLHNIYVPEDPLQVEFLRNSRCVDKRSTICFYTREFSSNPKSNKMKTDRPQHDHHADWVIAHLSSSGNFVSLRFHSCKPKLGDRLRNVIILNFALLNIAEVWNFATWNCVNRGVSVLITGNIPGTFQFYLSIRVFLTAVAVFRKPNAIPLCFSIDLVLNFLLSWLLVLLPSTFFLDILFSFSPDFSIYCFY